MTNKTRKIAVLTGDIVGSTALGPEKLEHAFDALKDCAETQAEWMGASLHFTRHRGDGWQVALAEPKYALRSALAFRAALRSLGAEFDSYIGTSEGDISGELSRDLNSVIQSTFIASGETLEDLKTTPIIKMVYHTIGYQDSAFILADLIAQNWTRIQAQAMYLALDPNGKSYTDVADQLGKSRQTITKTLKSAGYDHIDIALASIEKSIINV